LKALYLKYDREKFWENYWKEFDIDLEEFSDLNIYPINMTSKYISRHSKILECGFGGGRVIRHLHKYGYDIEGIEYDERIVEKLKEVDNSLKIRQGNVLDLQYNDNYFDITLCFGVICGLERNAAKAINELIRVTKKGSLLIVSVMLDNFARALQKTLNVFSNEEKNFYAWMNTRDEWTNYFKTFGLKVVDNRVMVSRYNIYYWTPLLRSIKTSDLRLARVKESAYKLNFLGELIWLLHKYVLRKQFAGGITFVLKNDK